MSMENSYVLVTGGAGYIGSHVVRQLGELGKKVIIIDNLSTGKKESVLHGELKICDLFDIQSVDKILSQYPIKSVLHFAGSIIVPESVEKPLDYYANNTLNTLNLLKLCKKHKINEFVFSSTAAVYGTPEKNATSITEETPTNPINPYGRSKLMTEFMLKDFHFANPEFNFIALRYFNVAGADLNSRIGQSFPGATHLIKVSCEAALKKRPHVKIFGTDFDTPDGTGIRDYIHVEDLAAAHILALNYLSKNKNSHILNCGYGKGFSVKEVISKIKEVTGIDFLAIEDARRPGDPACLVSNAEKIKSILGFNPKYNDLKVIIKTAFDWEKKC